MAISSTNKPPAAGELALAQLADDVARALSSYATALRRGGVHGAPGPATDGADTPKASPSGERRLVLGPRQQRLLALVELDNDEGLSNREICQRLGVSAANATALTKRLAELGHLVAVPDEAPVRYRRAAPHAQAKRRTAAD